MIQLERYDDVVSVMDKISWSRANRVLLVWPRRGRVLGRYIDLVLVQRACQKIGMQLACLVDDEIILDHAQELGIPVFHSVKKAQRLVWRRPRQKKIFEPRGRQPRAALEGQRQAARPKPGGWGNWLWLRWSAFGVGVLAVVLAALLMLPEVRINLNLAREQQTIEIPVYASPDLPGVNLSGGVPAHYLVVAVEGQDEQPTTGSVLIGEKAAQGQVQFTNLTDRVVVVPAGTRVQTLGELGVQFETVREVSLPARPGSTVEAAVQALQPGSLGNVRSGAIQAILGEVGTRLKVTNLAATSGGRDLKTAVVAAADVAVLKERLSAALQEKALQEVQARLPQGDRLFPETLQAVTVLREQQIPGSGAAAEHVSLTLQVEFRVWTMHEADLAALAREVLDANLPAGNTTLDSGAQIIDSRPPELEQGQLRWRIRATRTVRAGWDQRAVILAVAGRRAEEASQALARQFRLVQPAVIELTPEWWPLLPLLPGRIKMVVQ